MDRTIAEALHGFAGRMPLFDAFVALCAGYLPYVSAAAFIAVFFVMAEERDAFRRRQGMVRHALASAMGLPLAFGVAIPAMRLVFKVTRPFAEYGWKPLIAMAKEAPSFPSGHATFMFFLAAYAWRHDRRLAAWLFGFALINAAARGYAGVHWASDLLAGALLGVIIAHAADRAAPKSFPRIAREMYTE